MSVLLTVAQNRFLLNSLRGEGFLNMRLTREEAGAVIGIDPVRQVFEECVAARPCLMSRQEDNEFVCPTHGTLFLPALLRSSPLWKRIQEGLKLFGVAADDLSAITSFRLDMVQRPRFTAQLSRPTSTSPGTYGFLLGDAANAIHFWPGRGLNSGLASAVSLARSLSRVWQGRPLRDADFIRHEAAMSMLQYRHKSRAWNAMVTTDERGVTRAIKDVIADSMEGDRAVAAPGAEQSDLDLLLDRTRAIRDRLAPPPARNATRRGTAQPPVHPRSVDPAVPAGERRLGHPDRRRRGGRHRHLLPVGRPGLRRPPHRPARHRPAGGTAAARGARPGVIRALRP
ncbi:hypothetical protein O3Q52_18780 [Streptomyces sp. ActVer]|uniref:hypothetical protein n=1 Tax=Streptomyces sp. ActVer TaxID=3014558 RepID=UPI0022B4ED67|nr:hypothetical protein [Streptomyces sp. ActVer]MCZ4510201.1 hypothetical protein [Streptomyces sp. ActVer]